MASKHGRAVSGSVIDGDYSGEVKVILQNQRNTIYEFKAGNQIAQLNVERILTSEARAVDKLVETECGSKALAQVI